MRRIERRIDEAGELGRPGPVGAGAHPVLLVHGYGGTSRSMSAIARSLERDGVATGVISLPQFGSGDLDRDALLVASAAEALGADHGGCAVDVIGHSRGGVVSRLAQQVHAEAGVIDRVVTIASVNQGVEVGWALRLLPPVLQEFARSSPRIEQLRATRGQHDVVAVGTGGVDSVLITARAARIDGAPFLVVDDGRTLGPFSRIGHYRILRDATSYDCIREALRLPRGGAA
jgi:pimeloyl-ACP methyl ester carboxylesterase